MKMFKSLGIFLCYIFVAESIHASGGNDSQCEEGLRILDKFVNGPGYPLVDGKDYDISKANPCEIPNVKTVNDLYDALSPDDLTYDKFLWRYELFQSDLADKGGYTYIQIWFDIMVDFANWMSSFQQGKTDKISDIMDLETLTRFVEGLAVKYGETWLIALSQEIAAAYAYTRVEDTEQFSTALYESSTVEELQKKLDIVPSQAEVIWEVFVTTVYEPYKLALQKYSHVPDDYVYLGEKGIFNLAY